MSSVEMDDETNDFFDSMNNNSIPAALLAIEEGEINADQHNNNRTTTAPASNSIQERLAKLAGYIEEKADRDTEFKYLKQPNTPNQPNNNNNTAAAYNVPTPALTTTNNTQIPYKHQKITSINASKKANNKDSFQFPAGFIDPNNAVNNNKSSENNNTVIQSNKPTKQVILNENSVDETLLKKSMLSFMDRPLTANLKVSNPILTVKPNTNSNNNKSKLAERKQLAEDEIAVDENEKKLEQEQEAVEAAKKAEKINNLAKQQATQPKPIIKSAGAANKLSKLRKQSAAASKLRNANNNNKPVSKNVTIHSEDDSELVAIHNNSKTNSKLSAPIRNTKSVSPAMTNSIKKQTKVSSTTISSNNNKPHSSAKSRPFLFPKRTLLNICTIYKDDQWPQAPPSDSEDENSGSSDDEDSSTADSQIGEKKTWKKPELSAKEKEENEIAEKVLAKILEKSTATESSIIIEPKPKSAESVKSRSPATKAQPAKKSSQSKRINTDSIPMSDIEESDPLTKSPLITQTETSIRALFEESDPSEDNNMQLVTTPLSQSNSSTPITVQSISTTPISSNTNTSNAQSKLKQVVTLNSNQNNKSSPAKRQLEEKTAIKPSKSMPDQKKFKTESKPNSPQIQTAGEEISISPEADKLHSLAMQLRDRADQIVNTTDLEQFKLKHFFYLQSIILFYEWNLAYLNSPHSNPSKARSLFSITANSFTFLDSLLELNTPLLVVIAMRIKSAALYQTFLLGQNKIKTNKNTLMANIKQLLKSKSNATSTPFAVSISSSKLVEIQSLLEEFDTILTAHDQWNTAEKLSGTDEKCSKMELFGLNLANVESNSGSVIVNYAKKSLEYAAKTYSINCLEKLEWQ